MKFATDRIILLFFKDFESDKFFKNDRYVKRLVRPIYNLVSKGPKVNGFLVWHQLLVKALQGQGYRVEVNNYALAQRNPHYPVGLVGYPHLLSDWRLPNPALLGPALYDHPGNAPTLFADSRYKKYIVTCDWMANIFEPAYGDRVVSWHAGIDTKKWADVRNHPKTNDVLIYDKIRWNRDVYEQTLVQPIIDHLSAHGLSYQRIRYQKYDYPEYAQKLRDSRAMIFLCEHETQGMAYQEAMASNVPVLAWDNGFWLDPQRLRYTTEPIVASSVPYFSPDCGERFQHIEDFTFVFNRFWNKLDFYEPRRFVKNALSFEHSAKLYVQHYAAIEQLVQASVVVH